jgi:hypothetical protein
MNIEGHSLNNIGIETTGAKNFLSFAGNVVTVTEQPGNIRWDVHAALAEECIA